MAGMFLAALEATAVATAMPTAVADLQGMERYSWAFSVYLLTSTTTVPLYGKLADLFGRRRIYVAAMALFLVGSALCGAATSFNQFIAFRAVQGLGAGGVMPVSITLIGDIFRLEERGRIQGLFSAVWGVASLIGPVLGGVVTDAVSWRFVFYFAVPFGVVSAVMLQVFLREREMRRDHKLDLMGTTLLTLSVALLLVAILEGSEAWGWRSSWTLGFLLAALLLFALFVLQERSTTEPTLPFDLFSNRVIAVASAGSVVLGALLFTVTAFVPMFVQGVLGGNASEAGVPLIAMSVGWPIASAIAGRLIIGWGYRPLVIFGATLSVIGAGVLAFASLGAPLSLLIAGMLTMGTGFGFLSTPFLVSTQNAVPWNRRGIVTSSNQFFRTIGGAVAVAAFGAVLNARVRDRVGDQSMESLASGLHVVFLACLILAVTGFAVSLLFPGGSASQYVHEADT